MPLKIFRQTLRIIDVNTRPDTLDKAACGLAWSCVRVTLRWARALTQCLRRDDIVGHTPLVLFALRGFGQKAQHIAIYALKVCTVGLGIFEPLPVPSAFFGGSVQVDAEQQGGGSVHVRGDGRELASRIGKPGSDSLLEWVQRVVGFLPVNIPSLELVSVLCTGDRSLIIAVPRDVFLEEGIGGVRGALVVTLNDLDVFQLVRRCGTYIFARANVRHLMVS